MARVAADDSWAIVYYTSTIASPEGVDVIARSAKLSSEQLAVARSAIEHDDFLREKARGLVPILHKTTR